MTRKPTNEELKESETKFRLLTESTPAIITITRGDEILFANSAWEKISGYSRKEISKIKYSNVVHPDVLEKIRKRGLARLRGEKVPSRYNLKFLTKSRRTKWLDLSVIKFIYKGKPALLSSAFDITDRKKLEDKIKKEKDEREQRVRQALRDSEEKYLQLFNTVPAGIILYDAETQKLLDGNKAALNLYGYNREEFLNLTYWDITAEPEKSKETIPLVLSGKVKRVPLRYQKKKDGTLIPIEASVGMFKLNNRKVICGVATDISEYLQIQAAIEKTNQELRESEEKHRVLIETMNEGLLVQDKNDAITYINNKMAEMVGYSKDEMTGRMATDFQDDTDLSIIRKHRGKQKKGRQKSHEMKWKGKNGQKIYTIISPQPFFDEKNRPKGGFAVVTDITKLKQTEQKLRKRENELEIKTENLNEMNSALKVLLKTRDEDKIELEERVLYNVKELIEPYLSKLKRSGLKERQKVLIEILESNLNDIISPFSRRMTSTFLRLTPKELQIANLIKQGKTSKDIAVLMGISSRTVETHRKNLRDKIGIGNKKANLRTHLLSIH